MIAQGIMYVNVLKKRYTSLLCMGVAVAGFWLWLPSNNEIQALRAERDQLIATLSQLESRGGRAEIGECGGRLCVVVDEKSISQGWRTVKSKELMAILKGY